MTGFRENDLTRKQQLFSTLRREILAARVAVKLDERMDREASPEVRTLARMKLPSIAKLNRADEETDLTTTGRTRKQQLCRTLRRETVLPA